MIDSRVWKMAVLLFGSGMCALIYQMTWLRELRLVFGASTAASSAVLAIFMGGLGLGSALLGKKADKSPNPLLFYAKLELAIAAYALLTPFLHSAIRQVYFLSGGSPALGAPVATLLRLGLSTIILGLPTFLMGGTLPAAARAVESEQDAGRRRLAFLYGVNTIGAVTGTVLVTFFLLEILGTRNALFVGALINVLVAVTARSLSGNAEFSPQTATAPAVTEEPSSSPPPVFVYFASCLAGVCFFLMELVWYRMLSPILGGSTYTFGIILVVVLFGIGVGGAVYSAFSTNRRPTVRGFAMVCGLEAVLIAFPLAMGDAIAIWAVLLQPMSSLGLFTQSMTWIGITALVVLPASLVAGFQFPLLIGLLGRGGRDVGRHTGNAYAANTLGAICGALAGGFGLMPLLGAVGCWRLTVYLLLILSFFAIVLSAVRTGLRLRLAPTVAVCLIALALSQATGATAFWRHTPIGAGRVNFSNMEKNSIINFMHYQRRNTPWEAEGMETSVAISTADGLAFIVNGKSDGNALSDVATQVNLGLISGVMHPSPKTAMVIGLGTGSSAGWMAQIPSMERVDVAELEPAILEVARRCGPVNHDVLSHPKVRVIIGDAREVLLTSKDSYDLIVSEPSNPFRAGIASLYTREFYQAVSDRLSEDGYFSQWVQAYEVDTLTVRTIMATLASVFPNVEVWQTRFDDMLFVCSKKSRPLVAEELSARMKTEPYKTAFEQAWGVTNLEGFLARFVAGPAIARQVAEEEQKKKGLNTDDRMLVEFGFAKTVGKKMRFSLLDLKNAALVRRAGSPDVEGEVDREKVFQAYNAMYVFAGETPTMPIVCPKPVRKLAKTFQLYTRRDYASFLDAWDNTGRTPGLPIEWIAVAHSQAEVGDPAALVSVKSLEQERPIDYEAILGIYYMQKDEPQKAVEHISRCLTRLRTSPWHYSPLIDRLLKKLLPLAKKYKLTAPVLADLVSEPFCLYATDDYRKALFIDLAIQVGVDEGLAAVQNMEPHIPWNDPFLRYRYQASTVAGSKDQQEEALSDLQEYVDNTSATFSELLGISN